MEKQIAQLNDQVVDLSKYVDIAAEVEPLKEQARVLKDLEVERDSLKHEVEQLTSELHTLSAAFELRGKRILILNSTFFLRTNDPRDGKAK